MITFTLITIWLMASPLTWADDHLPFPPPPSSDSATEAQAPDCHCQLNLAQDSLDKSGINYRFTNSVAQASGNPPGVMDAQTAKAHMTKIKNLMLRKIRNMACEKRQPKEENSDSHAHERFSPPDDKMADVDKPSLENLDPDQIFNAGGMPRTTDPLVQDDIESMKEDVQEALDKKLASCERKKNKKLKQQQDVQAQTLQQSQSLQQALQQRQLMSSFFAAPSGTGSMSGSFNSLGPLGSSMTYQMPITSTVNTMSSYRPFYGLYRWRILGN
jgi:hypothetical protein